MKIFFFSILLTFSSSIFAKVSDYPELMVSPLASERLKIESIREQKSKAQFQLPITTSAAMTLISGVVQYGNTDTNKDPKKRAALAGTLIGSTWLLTNYYLSYHYRGFRRAYKNVSKIRATNNHQKLIKERLAEEEINRLGRLGTTMKWLSFFSNGISSVYMISKAQKDSAAKLTSALSIITSLAPIIFSNHWSDIAHEQKNYKKRVYGPIVHGTFFQDHKTKKLSPGILLSMSF